MSNSGFSRKIRIAYRLLTIPLLNRVLTILNRNGVRDSLHMNVVNNEVIESHFIDEMYAISQLPGFGHAIRSSLQVSATIFGVKKEIFERITARFSELTLPILVLWGENDPVFALKEQYKSLQKLPNAEMKIINNAGHLLYLEKPLQVQAHIERFLL